ncbi:hypothetical protein QWJ26_18060 [Streptomyces sp. CSDS2]|uniref:hypothetical protein n=1 Tax=Streptomyces sp. CSDS2 TaxID=3055051 RepID=UPI0025AF6AFF|nr:hypothetical protein [Streptomyces sp. CSDS2]MDN3261683.1 hypothetical protein [Streptomyces sp. CSDS2]
MTDKLGPLERIDGRWVLGDARRPDGTWVEVCAQGLHQHERDTEGLLVPWSRIMLGMRVTLGGKYPRRGNGFGLTNAVPGPWKGRGHGYLHMTVRHPYEDATLRFALHPGLYSPTEVVLLEQLLTHAVREKQLPRLADPDELARMVAYLAPLRPRTSKTYDRAVAEAFSLSAGSQG